MICRHVNNPEHAKKEVTHRIGLEEKPTFESLNEPIHLNLGCGMDYKRGFTGIDINPPPYSIQHSVTEPFPLENKSVESIITEEMIEHLEEDDIVPLLNECHRILKPEGLMRIGVPDYASPKNMHKVEQVYDPDYPDHSTFTRYSLLSRLIKESNFEEWDFKHYWNDGQFHYQPVDYSKGYIRRAIDNKDYGGREAIMNACLLVDLKRNHQE